jgi:UDP-N-acetylmuramoyl-L-alanyl-D-glutamate--2,6-diaminopimelate ligase
MLFSQMLKEGCSAVSMEVSSHALDQSRVFGIGFKVAVFTNLTQDHLDYHGTMERYFDAKKILFDSLAADSTAVINVDDSWGERLCSDAKLNIVSYGITSKATVQATDVRLSLDGTVLTLNDEGQTRELRTHLVGRFNAYNVLAAYAAGKAVGIAPEIILQGIAAVPNIRGRFERIVSSKGWTAIIDFAHTPDALEKCLKTIDDVLPSKKRGRIITVFGAGGDRDRAKRPLMGRVVGEWSDIAVVTSDNPRTEDPEKIVDEVLSGIQGKAEVRREPDRRAAIAWALQQAVPGDVVLIAGKGHEEYQIIGTQKRHFSDREQVELFV